MLATSLKQRLADQQKEIADSLAADWRTVAIGCATGELDPDPMDLLLELDRLGKTPDDLQAVVDLVERRRELADAVALLPAATRLSAELTAKRDAASARFAEAEARHKEEIAALTTPINVAQERIRAATAARRELLRGCSESIRNAMLSIRHRLDPLEQESASNAGMVQQHESRVMQAHANDATRAATEAAKVAVAELAPKIAELRGQIVELEVQAMQPNAIDISESKEATACQE